MVVLGRDPQNQPKADQGEEKVDPHGNAEHAADGKRPGKRIAAGTLPAGEVEVSPASLSPGPARRNLRRRCPVEEAGPLNLLMRGMRTWKITAPVFPKKSQAGARSKSPCSLLRARIRSSWSSSERFCN